MNYDLSSNTVGRYLKKTPFLLDNSEELPYGLKSKVSDGKYTLYFVSPPSSSVGSVKVTGNDLKQTINELVETVFQAELEKRG